MFNFLKKRITRATRLLVWENEFGIQLTGKCPILHCLEELSFNNFDCGHIKSEFNGGQNLVKNLRPICRSCNSSMGSTNWGNYIEIIKKEDEYSDDFDTDSSGSKISGFRISSPISKIKVKTKMI